MAYGVAGALILAGSAAAAQTVRIVDPSEGEPLLGPATIRLEVDPAASVDRVEVFVQGRWAGVAHPPEWSLPWNGGGFPRGATLLAAAYAGDRLVGRHEVRTRAVANFQEEWVELVQLYPVVTDATGAFVRDLQRWHFEVLEDGSPMEIEYFSRDAASLTILMLLDTSGSMAGKLGRLQTAAASFIADLRAQDDVGLSAFNHTFRELAPLGSSLEDASEAIWSLEPSGGTALYDAVVRSAAALQRVQGRKVLFVFSDGLDRDSIASLPQAAQALTDAGVILYAVGAPGDPGDAQGRTDLRRLARDTGGRAWVLTRQELLRQTLGQLMEELRAQYVLGYRPPEGPPGRRRLNVRIRHRGYLAYDVRHRRSYLYTPNRP